jgi:hypothetical protein
VNVLIAEVPVFRPAGNLLIISALLTAPFDSAVSQGALPPSSRPVEIFPTAGYLAFGTYFTGPGGVRFSNQDGFGYGAQLVVGLWRNLSLVGSVLHGTSDWSFESVPLVGRLTVGGASLWFYDAGLRLSVPLGASIPVAAFGQASAGAIRYAVDNALFTERATNFAFSGGAGLTTRAGGRFSLQALVKDYIASFRSVDDAAAFGVEGRRAHTVAFLIGVGFGF